MVYLVLEFIEEKAIFAKVEGGRLFLSSSR
jgi:hypothetical protein